MPPKQTASSGSTKLSKALSAAKGSMGAMPGSAKGKKTGSKGSATAASGNKNPALKSAGPSSKDAAGFGALQPAAPGALLLPAPARPDTGKQRDRPPRSERISVQEPWYTLIALGMKTVEVRLADYFSSMEPPRDPKEGDTITMKNLNLGVMRELVVKVEKITKYASLKELIDAEGMDKVTPVLHDFAHVDKMYRRFYKNRMEEKGLIAIRFKLVKENETKDIEPRPNQF